MHNGTIECSGILWSSASLKYELIYIYKEIKCMPSVCKVGLFALCCSFQKDGPVIFGTSTGWKSLHLRWIKVGIWAFEYIPFLLSGSSPDMTEIFLTGIKFLMLCLHFVPGSHGNHGSQKRSSPLGFGHFCLRFQVLRCLTVCQA